ncbi:MAG: hypothetical protein J0L92_23610 [Deltaproteobacteria bacterium]|nr:hypothetical protein [Deltaproteobacteria bacterium]
MRLTTRVPALTALGCALLLRGSLADPTPSPCMQTRGESIMLSARDGARVRVDESGAALSIGGERVMLAVQSLARAHTPPPSFCESPPARDSLGRAVRALSASVHEWWLAAPAGLEHGVDLAERPKGVGPLELTLALGGAEAHSLTSDAVALVTDGHAWASYAGLTVIDADGVVLPATMRPVRSGIAITIDDDEARYPIVIDPIVTATEQATLLPGAGALDDQAGRAVAISADGLRAVVGVPNRGSDRGLVGVYVRSAGSSTWGLERSLSASDAAGGDTFGTSVAINADGTVLAVGAPGDNAGATDNGSVRIFRRTGADWTEDAAPAISGAQAGERLGTAVAISGDGVRLAVGAPLFDAPGLLDAGRVLVLAWDGVSWSVSTTATGTVADGALGSSVAMNRAASRAIAGAPGDRLGGSFPAGSAVVLGRFGSWSVESTLVPADGVAGDGFGTAVAVSDDGLRVAVGVPFDEVGGLSNVGSVRVFVRASATLWTEESRVISPVSEIGTELGSSVALGANGRTLLAGSMRRRDSGGTTRGTVEVYLRSLDWRHDATFSASVGSFADFGASLAMTPDVTSALVGAPNDTTPGVRTGTARVFALNVANGAPCDVGTDCVSGFCTDGVCCNTACAGGPTDCQACTHADTGGAEGTCLPRPSTVVCSASTGPCDPAGFCSGTSNVCADPGLSPAGTECRAGSRCDPAESCTGTSGACPADVRSPNGTSCADGDLCNGDELCMAGACTGLTPRVCDDGDVCTAESCDALTGCASMPIAGCCHTDADCDDLNACTIDRCSAPGGACSHVDSCAGDAGPVTDSDAGPVTDSDAGVTDSDAGPVTDSDAGPVTNSDAGAGFDAGSMGAVDVGTADVGSSRDAAARVDGADAHDETDAGSAEPPAAAGCACTAVGERHGRAGLAALVLAALVSLRARRRRRV